MQDERRSFRSNRSPMTADNLLGKIPPSNTDAERAVLGAILLHDAGLAQITDFLIAEDFYVPAHQIIYQSMVHDCATHAAYRFSHIQDELTKKDQLDAIGGLSYIVALQEDIPAAGLIEQHARIIKEKAVLRELIGSATGIITNCYTQDDKSIEVVLDHAEKTIFNIAHKRANQTFVQLDIWLKKTFKHLSDIKSHGKGITGVPSGYQ